MLVRRDRPQHVDEQLHSRQGCLWSSVHNSSCCFLGQFVVWFCFRPVRSIVYFGAGSSSSSGCAWYAEIRLIYIPSSVFVEYAYLEYRIHLFSSPVVAVFCCETNHKPVSAAYLHRLHAGRPVSRPVNVSWLPRICRADVELVIVVLTAHTMMGCGPGRPAKTRGPSHEQGGLRHLKYYSSNSTPYFMGRGPCRPVKLVGRLMGSAGRPI